MKVALIYNENKIDPNDVINVFGMPTKEHYSKKAVERVARALEKGGHNVKVIEGDIHVIDELKEFMPKVVAGEKPGMVFNMAYGVQGQNRYTHVPAMMEMMGIPYIGSGPEGHAIVQDKVMTKIVLQKNKIPTPGFWVFRTPDDKFDDMIFPVIVKPKLESTSMGMEVVDNWPDLREAVRKQIEKFTQDILVEQFIPGREFAVGLLGNGPTIETLPIVEINLEGDPNKIQTKDDKVKKGGIDKICPAPLSDEKAEELRKLCKDAFYTLGLNDYTRVDIRMDKDENFYILELNSMASLGMGGSFFHAAKTAGYTYESLVNRILDVAVIRYFGHPITQSEQAPDTSKPLRVLTRTYLRGHLQGLKESLEDFVNLNTHVYNIDNVNELGLMIARRLRHMGFEENIHKQYDIGDFHYFTNHTEKENDVLIVSHLDTHYGPHDLVHYREDDDRIYGSGIAESKGGLVVMLGALQALRFAKRLKKIKCGILLTTDDSLGGRHSKTIVEEYSKSSRYVVGLKSASIDGGIITTCHGRSDYQVRFASSPGKNSIDLHGIIPVLSKKVLAIEKISKSEKDFRIRTTAVDSKGSHGHTPDFATLSLVSSYKTKKLGDELDKKIRNVMKKREAGMAKIDVEINKIHSRAPVEEEEADTKFYELVKEIADLLEIKIKPHAQIVSSDISNVPSELAALDGFGPIGHKYRSPNEFIVHDSIVERSALLASVIYRCSKTE
ncbi:MAG: M20/M25/M40 family metallo-hydrolase [Crenarchaeota archaeon]|nr:MAG: M20/M25/M40 family metallo-hydrolase [Thermoproteota archaeon]RDJ34322.1 MAG: M20/M25/M40 family metallo-hydrolase [Thermoproteota archaeon]RDJ37211.1 MAG: M20/M25/M40 family metallo-hydrolase [Thermoproteota archaeon]RDJ37908.1 MAG: M20/M25/M40 family metallo-hydrolase [Thermoproteota archaeon]